MKFPPSRSYWSAGMLEACWAVLIPLSWKKRSQYFSTEHREFSTTNGLFSVGGVLLWTLFYYLTDFLVLHHGSSFYFFLLVYGFKNMQLRSSQGAFFDSENLPTCFAPDTYTITSRIWKWHGDFLQGQWHSAFSQLCHRSCDSGNTVTWLKCSWKL